MKLFQALPQKVQKIGFRISDRACRLFDYDWITRVKIAKRNDLRLIGEKYGGWVVPTDLIDEHSICYCVGCGEDISFDLGLIERFNCEVYAFDPTPRAIAFVNEVAGENPNYHFFDVGLWDKEDTLKFYEPDNPKHVSYSLLNLQKTETYINVKVKRLKGIMEENDHEKITLLKLDIEGAEYKVVQTIIEDNVDVNVICIEYDEIFQPLDKDFRKRVKASIFSLVSAGYSLVHAQGKGNYTFVKYPVAKITGN